ncbi:MAG: hypothetical protein Q7T66_04860 [Herminiimonas sp.]|uniref:hypothetical protein n=1 Tax=Herminiimonas sp. TaxID=1926289 RepID=UPI002720D020|nr:hypothetical protein [Herminiimonas sp.]MDO9419976.1 hypothetical protein [Herminiimonas sp.]
MVINLDWANLLVGAAIGAAFGGLLSYIVSKHFYKISKKDSAPANWSTNAIAQAFEDQIFADFNVPGVISRREDNPPSWGIPYLNDVKYFTPQGHPNVREILFRISDEDIDFYNADIKVSNGHGAAIHPTYIAFGFYRLTLQITQGDAESAVLIFYLQDRPKGKKPHTATNQFNFQ